MSSALKLIDNVLNKLNTDAPNDCKSINNDDEKNIDNHDNPLFKKKDFKILFCGMGYPYYPNRLQYLNKLGYHNITVLPQVMSNEEAEKILYQHIVEEKNNDYDGVLNTWLAFSKAIKSKPNILKNCKVISCVSSGYKHEDEIYCKQNNIHLTNCPAAVNKTAADMAVGLMIATCRQFYNKTKLAQKLGIKHLSKDFYIWCGKENDISDPITKDLFGSTVGIVGLGNIGKEISKRLAFGFDCKCIYFNGNGKRRKSYDEKYGATHIESFDELIKMSDFVVAICPFNKTTKHMFNERVFKMMKNDAVFINVSRGGLCDTNALISALKNGWIYGAGLDVTDPEPLPSEHELYKLENCIVLPHVGSSTIKCRNRMMDTSIDNMLRVLNDLPCSNLVC